jgi:transcriptional regulator with XRE-family HTH domain
MDDVKQKTPKDVLAERVTSLMKRRGVNDEQVSRGTGGAVSARTVLYMRQPDVGNPTIDSLIAVAEYFGIAVWELLFDPEQDTRKLIDRGLKGRTFSDATKPPQSTGQDRRSGEQDRRK